MPHIGKESEDFVMQKSTTGAQAPKKDSPFIPMAEAQGSSDSGSDKDQDTSNSQNIRSSETTRFEDSKPKNQLPVLDGLRAIACLGVLIYHLNVISAGIGVWGPVYNIHDIVGTLTFISQALGNSGHSGIYLFFVLSGFLLFLPYAKSLLFDSPWPSLRRFYLRRIFRIVPAYYATVFLVALFLHPAFLHASHWHDLWLLLTFRMGLSLSGQLNGVFWTLAIEFQFYLLLPILAWLFGLIVCRGSINWRMSKLFFCLLMMIVWGLLTRYWGLYLSKTNKLDFLIPHRVLIALQPFIYGDHSKFLEVFAIGMLVCTLYTYIQYAPSAQSWSGRMHRLSPLLLTVGLAIVFFLCFWYYYFTDLNIYNFILYTRSVKYPIYHVIFTFLDPYFPTLMYLFLPEWECLGYAIGYGLCLLALLYSSASVKRLLEGSTLGWVASISFSLYMWHQPLMYIFQGTLLFKIQQQNLGHLIEYVAFWCWTLVIALPVSAMFYRWVEKSGIRLGDRLLRKLGK